MPAIVAIGAGATHSLALGLDGSVWAWGANSQGQLGDGSQTTRLVPIQIAMPGTGWTVPTPTLTSLTPTAGPVGTSVTLTGTDFGAAPSTSTVAFNGVAAAATAWSPTSITTSVPTGASNGPVTVTVGGQASNGLSFTVASPPTLATLSPAAGPVSAAVTLTGTDFGASQGASTVSFNGAAATPTAWSPTSITAPVPAGATSGPVTVTVDGQTSNGLSFAVVPTPTLTSVSPSSGGIGTAVTLTGANFGATQGSSVVSFNGTAATPTAWSATNITAPVPSGATTGPVTVTVGGQLSNSVGFTVISPPTLTATTPNAAAVGAVVTLTGANFGPTQGSSTVLFNGTVAVPTAWSASSITTPVPSGATSGLVTVIVGGLTSNGVGFTVGSPTTTTSVTITDPFPGTTFNAPASLTVSAAAAITGGTIARVEFYDGPLLIGTASAAPYSVAWVAPVEGPHDLTAVAVDQFSATTVSPLVSVMIAPAGATLGTLAIPLGTPGGGVYAPGVMVSLTAAPGAEIRYTRNGGTPTSTSALFVGPLTVTSTETIRARAFQTDWTESAEMVAAYQIDTTPPTIAASVSPQANAQGWHHSPVMVSFTCNDTNGVASCPEPVVVNSSGTDLLVSGTVTDLAGNQVTTSVTLDVDLTAPTVVITNPANQDMFAPGPATIEANVSDLLSGVSTATCNDVAAVVTGGTLSCVVSLPDGPSTVVVHARDIAGNGGSASVTLTSNSPRTALFVSPKRRTLLVGDNYDVRVMDQLGRLVGDAILTSTNPAVATATFYEPGEPAILEALAAGTTTITATAGSLTADLAVTVVGGTGLPAGTAEWTFDSPGGAYVETNLAARDSTDAETLVSAVQSSGTGFLMHGLNAAGEIVHTEVTPTPPAWPAPADTLGGFFSFSGIGGSSEGFVVRRNAFMGQGTTWEYRSAPHVAPSYQPFQRAQARDGTLYVIEESRDLHPGSFWGGTAFVVVLDGATGTVRGRVPLPPTNYCVIDHDTGQPRLRQRDVVPAYSPPLVGRDGAAYVSVATRFQGCVFNDISGPASRERNELFMVRIAPTGSSQTMSIRHWTAFYCTNCGNPGQVIYYAGAPVPDGQGNVLSTGLQETWNAVTGYSTFDTVTYRYGPSGAGETSFDAFTSAAGRDGVYEVSGGQVVARAPLTGAVRWSASLTGNEQVLQVLEDGGVTLYDPVVGQTSTIDGSGQRQPPEQLPLSGPVFNTDVGELVGSQYSPDGTNYVGIAKVVTSNTTDCSVYPTPTGGNTDQLRGLQGIYIKGHPAKFYFSEVPEQGVAIPWYHASLHVVPHDQSSWGPILATLEGGAAKNQHCNYFVTFGANDGGGGDTGGGNVLTAGINRNSDRTFRARYRKRVSSEVAAEGQHLVDLIDRVQYFITNHNSGSTALPYKARPNNNGDNTYNSNSFIHGLLRSADVPPPPITNHFGAWGRFPGYLKPVPQVYFGVQP